MKFKIKDTTKLPQIAVVYRADEHSFGVEPDGDPIPNAIFSIQLGTLQLHVGEDARIVYVDGLCTHMRWKPATLRPPPSKPGMLLVVDMLSVPGVSVALESETGWPVFFDRQSGWICIGNSVTSPASDVIEFAPCSLAVVQQGLLEAVWLKPLGGA